MPIGVVVVLAVFIASVFWTMLYVWLLKRFYGTDAKFNIRGHFFVFLLVTVFLITLGIGVDSAIPDDWLQMGFQPIKEILTRVIEWGLILMCVVGLVSVMYYTFALSAKDFGLNIESED